MQLKVLIALVFATLAAAAPAEIIARSDDLFPPRPPQEPPLPFIPFPPFPPFPPLPPHPRHA